MYHPFYCTNHYVSAVVHPSFRLANISIAYHYLIAVIARLIIIYYQVCGIPIHSEILFKYYYILSIDLGEDSIILTCDIIRDQFLGYYISQLVLVYKKIAVVTFS